MVRPENALYMDFEGPEDFCPPERDESPWKSRFEAAFEKMIEAQKHELMKEWTVPYHVERALDRRRLSEKALTVLAQYDPWKDPGVAEPWIEDLRDEKRAAKLMALKVAG